MTSRDRLTLTSKTEGKAAYQITNAKGELISDGKRGHSLEKFTVDILNWPSGVYTIEIADEVNAETLHFVKT